MKDRPTDRKKALTGLFSCREAYSCAQEWSVVSHPGRGAGQARHPDPEDRTDRSRGFAPALATQQCRTAAITNEGPAFAGALSRQVQRRDSTHNASDEPRQKARAHYKNDDLPCCSAKRDRRGDRALRRAIQFVADARGRVPS